MLDQRVVEKIDECVGEFSVVVSFRNVEDHFAWAYVGVYGPNADGNIRFLGDKLAGLLSWWDFLGGHLHVCFRRAGGAATIQCNSFFE